MDVFFSLFRIKNVFSKSAVFGVILRWCQNDHFFTILHNLHNFKKILRTPIVKSRIVGLIAPFGIVANPTDTLNKFLKNIYRNPRLDTGKRYNFIKSFYKTFYKNL